MKNAGHPFALFALFLLLHVTNGNVQGQSFGGPGTQWFYSGHNAAPPEYSGYIQFRYTGDTLIDNRQVNLLLREDYNYQGDLVSDSVYFVIQASDTVFLYRKDQSRFTVFLVFNRNQGDTISLEAPYDVPGAASNYRIVIDSVRTVEIDGIPLKRYETTALDDFYWPGVLMDRIGGLGWFFPIPVISIPEGPGEIRCYADEQIDTNFNPYACDYRLSISVSDVRVADAFVVAPNPVYDEVCIESDRVIEAVQLFDFTGRLLLASAGRCVSLKFLPDGQYVLGARTKDGTWHFRTIIKY